MLHLPLFTLEWESHLPRLRATVVQVTPFQQNCSNFRNEETSRGAVVDPGGDLEQVRAAIDANGVTVEKTLLTHGHIDHAGGAADLRDALGVPAEGPQVRAAAFAGRGRTDPTPAP